MGKTTAIDGIEVPIGSHEGKTIVIGSDHHGFDYKKRVIEVLKDKGYSVIDVGTDSSERCDYPIISDKIGRQISEVPYARAGIGICGSGIGILIPASKYQNIHVARCLSPKEAEISRRHNNANLLGIGADCVDLETALAIIDSWLTTPFYSEPLKERCYLDRYVQTVKLRKKVI